MDDMMQDEIPDDAIEMLRLQLDAELMRQHQEAMLAELEVRGMQYSTVLYSIRRQCRLAMEKVVASPFCSAPCLLGFHSTSHLHAVLFAHAACAGLEGPPGPCGNSGGAEAGAGAGEGRGGAPQEEDVRHVSAQEAVGLRYPGRSTELEKEVLHTSQALSCITVSLCRCATALSCRS